MGFGDRVRVGFGFGFVRGVHLLQRPKHEPYPYP